MTREALLYIKRVLELLASHWITDTDMLKHALEAHARWAADLRAGRLVERATLDAVEAQVLALQGERERLKAHIVHQAQVAEQREAGTYKRQLSVEGATRRLESELERLKARDPVLSTNVSLNLRGIPRGDERPADPGIAVYFSFRGKATVLACDHYTTVAGNIAAVAGHIEALRRIERYGVGTIEQALAGYRSLPADTAANWRAVFGFAKESKPTLDQVDSAFKKAARERHPDLGGTDLEMSHINRARDYALLELNG